MIREPFGAQRGVIGYGEGDELGGPLGVVLPVTDPVTRAFAGVRGTGRFTIVSRFSLYTSLGVRYTVSWLDEVNENSWFVGTLEHGFGLELAAGADIVW